MTMALADATMVHKIFYNIDMPEWTWYIKAVFNMLPGFHFSKLFGDISRITCKHVLPETLMWVPGRPWETKDLFAS